MQKRKTKFYNEWTEEFKFISRSRKDDFHVFGTVCRYDVEIGGEGKSAVYQHITTDKSSFREICKWLFNRIYKK